MSKLGETSTLSVALTTEQRGMLETLAAKKYKCPQSLSHAVRMMIEGDYRNWKANEIDGRGDENGDTRS